MRRTKDTVMLPEPERAQLRTLIGQGTAPARLLTHARILRKVNQGEGGPTSRSPARWRSIRPPSVASAAAGLEAALHRKAPNRVCPRRLDGDAEAQLVALACGAPPAGRERWTLRLLADELVRREVVDAVSDETVRQTFQQTRSSPG